MAYRAWPAALLTGAALAAACVVVGDHVIETSDGCLDSAGWFTATPAAWPTDPIASGTVAKSTPSKARIGPSPTIDAAGQTSDDRYSDPGQISGCLDLDRIEIPAPAPAPDGRA